MHRAAVDQVTAAVLAAATAVDFKLSCRASFSLLNL